MSSLVHQLLRQFVRELEPTRQHIEQASASQQRIRSLLESGTIGDSIEDSFLIGSYARHTVVAPIDDIDILFQINPHHWNKGWPIRPNPRAVIATFHRAVKYRYPDSQVRKQRRSVGLLMSRRAIDIVPALATRSPGVFRIPDTEEDDWIETAPQQHADAVAQINQRSNNLVVPLVKLVKFWNKTLPKTARLKSFALETMVARLFEAYQITDLGVGLRDFLDFVVHCGPMGGPKPLMQWDDDLDVSLGRFSIHAPDLTELDGNALAGVEGTRCIKFVEKARTNRDRIQSAIDKPTEGNARRQLGTVFQCDL